MSKNNEKLDRLIKKVHSEVREISDGHLFIAWEDLNSQIAVNQSSVCDGLSLANALVVIGRSNNDIANAIIAASNQILKASGNELKPSKN